MTKTERKRRDLEDRLRSLIADTAIVDAMYGGFEISVRQPESFPWSKAMDLLTTVGHDIWIRRQNERILIITKPPSV